MTTNSSSAQIIPNIKRRDPKPGARSEKHRLCVMVHDHVCDARLRRIGQTGADLALYRQRCLDQDGRASNVGDDLAEGKGRVKRHHHSVLVDLEKRPGIVEHGDTSIAEDLLVVGLVHRVLDEAPDLFGAALQQEIPNALQDGVLNTVPHPIEVRSQGHAAEAKPNDFVDAWWQRNVVLCRVEQLLNLFPRSRSCLQCSAANLPGLVGALPRLDKRVRDGLSGVLVEDGAVFKHQHWEAVGDGKVFEDQGHWHLPSHNLKGAVREARFGARCGVSIKMVGSDGEDLHNNGRAGRDVRRLAVVVDLPCLKAEVDDDPVDALDGDLGAATGALLASPVKGLRSRLKRVPCEKWAAKVIGGLYRGLGPSGVLGDATVVEVGTEAKHAGQVDEKEMKGGKRM